MNILSGITSYNNHVFNIKTIISKDYQTRSQLQHRFVVNFLKQYFTTLPQWTIKLISFYIILIQNDGININNKNKYDGILIKLNSLINNEDQQNNPQKINLIDYNKKNTNFNQSLIGPSQQYLYISYDNYLSCQNLGQSSIQQQIQFFSSSEYLCSMPKKKYFTILRNSKIKSYAFRQNIYQEGQQIQSTAGVYLVRIGQMVYLKQIKGRSVEVFRFSSGHLLGTLQLESNSHETAKRSFTVKSKNSKTIVYQMSQQFFKSFIKPFCQKVIQSKQKKLIKYLSDKSNQLDKFHQIKQGFGINNNSLRKSMSQSTQFADKFRNNMSNTPNMITYRQLPSLIKTTRRSVQIQQDDLRKTSYFALKNQGPLKHYPMTIQRSKFTTSEFKDLQKLLNKNQKINKIRQLKKSQDKRPRNQILFDLFESSWKFDKEQTRKNRQRRNNIY